MDSNGAAERSGAPDSLLIVTPSLNQARYIQATINSVLAQLGPEDLYVIVDGGSTDGTAEILGEYKDQRLRIHINSGQSQAGALAFAFSTYTRPLCAYLNTDDFLLPGAVTHVKRTFAETAHIHALYSNRVFIDENNQATGLWELPNHSNYLMSRWDYIPQETTFWRAGAMEQAGAFDGSLDFAVDYDFFVRLMRNHTMVRHDCYLATFRSHSLSKTNTINASVGKKEVAAIQNKYQIQIQWHDRIIGRLLRHWIAWRSARKFSLNRVDIQLKIDQALSLDGAQQQ